MLDIFNCCYDKDTKEATSDTVKPSENAVVPNQTDDVKTTTPTPEVEISQDKVIKSDSIESTAKEGEDKFFYTLKRIGYISIILILIISHVSSGWTAKYTSPPYSVNDIPNLSGKFAIVTGANTGIGKITAFELVNKGAHVVLTSRDVKKGMGAVNDIKSKLLSTSTGIVSLEHLDLSSLKDVQKFSSDILKKYGRKNLDILILNAGVMMCPYEKTIDGFESQFATNHLGHFLLVKNFLNWIKKSSTRVVTVSSSAHHFTYPEGIDYGKLRSNDSYNPLLAYGQSKLANILFSNELALKLKGTGATSNVVHPGMIKTELGRHIEKIIKENPAILLLTPLAVLLALAQMGPDMGALTQLFVATSKSLAGVSGKYFVPIAVESSTSDYAKNVTLQKKLWQISERFTKNF